MRIIIAVECRGDNPAPELAYVLNEIAEKATEEGLAVGERMLKGIGGNVIGKMFIEDTVGFLSGEAFNNISNAIKQRPQHFDCA